MIAARITLTPLKRRVDNLARALRRAARRF